MKDLTLGEFRRATEGLPDNALIKVHKDNNTGMITMAVVEQPKEQRPIDELKQEHETLMRDIAEGFLKGNHTFQEYLDLMLAVSDEYKMEASK